MPLFVPIVIDLGFDPIWFGVLFCLNMQLSYITPPFGPSAFYLKGVVGDDITVTEIYRSTIPYVFLIIIALAIVMYVPEIALWLPKHVG
jgi:TRAP-type mannitol/chloroaromatic compound transport system permease large subunit